MNGTNEATLVVGPSWIGDMVLTQSLLQVLKHNQPERAIDVLAPAWSRPLTGRMPEVRNAIDAPFEHGELALGARLQLGRQLRGQYQRAIVLPNSWKSALVPFFARIPVRTGYRGELRFRLLNDLRTLNKAELPMTVQRFLALAEPKDHPRDPALGIPAPKLEVKPEAIEESLRALQLTHPTARLLALCPGAAYGPAKRWPANYFAQLARRKLDEGWQVWLFGSQDDAAICDEINIQCQGACTNLSDQTSLDQAVDLLSLADYAISNDSGLMHIAAALGRPLVAIFGSTSPQHTPPLGTSARVLWKHLSCSPCFKRTCPLKHMNCLNQITVDQVLTQMVVTS